MTGPQTEVWVPGEKTYQMGRVTSIVLGFFPWLVGVIHIVKWIIEGAF